MDAHMVGNQSGAQKDNRTCCPVGLFKMPRVLRALMNRCTYHPSVCVGETEKNSYDFYSC